MNRLEYDDWWARIDQGLLVETLPEPERTLARHVMALQDRIDRLMHPDDHDQVHGSDCRCPYVRCACVYDHPDAVCMTHAAQVRMSLGEQPHSSAGCRKRGRPHLGPCTLT